MNITFKALVNADTSILTIKIMYALIRTCASYGLVVYCIVFQLDFLIYWSSDKILFKQVAQTILKEKKIIHGIVA